MKSNLNPTHIPTHLAPFQCWNVKPVQESNRHSRRNMKASKINSKATYQWLKELHHFILWNMCLILIHNSAQCHYGKFSEEEKK
jgi:hypothetical protein